MNKIIWILPLLLTSIIANGQKKLSLDQMQTDFDQLATEFKANHQGLYFYTDVSTANKKIDSLRSTLNKETNYREFFNTLAKLTALTNEGHTNIKYPKKVLKTLSKQNGFLPVGIFFCGKNQDAVITSVYNPLYSDVKGKKIISINGIIMSEIMAEIIPGVATDGFNRTSAYEWISWDFPFFYYQLKGLTNSFELELEDIVGNRSKKVLKPLTYQTINKLSDVNDFLLVNGLFKKQDFKIINDSTAYMAMVAFQGADKVINIFYSHIFTNIKNRGIKNLIIDMQRNVGGSEGMENYLASHLIKQPFKKYREVTATMNAYNEFKGSKTNRLDKWEVINGTPKRGNFTLMSNYLSEHDYSQINSDLVFEGNVFVLTSGATFSGGAEFASMLKMQNRATFIGEEVGGAHEGNVSGYSDGIKLKHSNISVSLPLIHFKMNSHPEIKGRGVIPDHLVPQGWGELLKGINSKLEFVLKLIEGKEE